MSLLSVALAKDILVVHSANGDYTCFEQCGGPAESCPKVICPIEWETEQEAVAVEGQFPGMDMMGGFPGMGYPGMGFPGMGFPGMGFPGYPGMGGMGGYPGMGYPDMGNSMSYPGQPGQANACGCVNACQPCMWW